MKEELRIKKSGGLAAHHPSAFLLLPSKSTGFPLASAVSHPAMETQGPTAQRVKNSQREGNEHHRTPFASAALQQPLRTGCTKYDY
jgi:hypothetical protein